MLKDYSRSLLFSSFFRNSAKYRILSPYKTMSKETSKRKAQDNASVPTKQSKSAVDEENRDFKEFLKKISKDRSSCGGSIMEVKFNEDRVRTLSEQEDLPKECTGVLYWMSRDQRVQDNWAFLYAQKLALRKSCPLHVCFCLVPKFLSATWRHYEFILSGLKEVEKECEKLNICFYLLLGEAKTVLPSFLESHKISALVTDFSPLRVPLGWIEEVKNRLPADVPFYQVDAHNIVPCWFASPKLEYGARTIRNKIHNKLKDFLVQFPPVISHPYAPAKSPSLVDWVAAEKSLTIDRSVGPVEWAKPGTSFGMQVLFEFLHKRLKGFSALRNDPTKDNLSHLSPWLHFGQVSVQRCILEVLKFKAKAKESVDAFVEEAVVRRELADNFCFYNEKYDKIEGAYEWAKSTLKDHEKDKREYIYTKKEFEESKTHDPLWNAAQNQMVQEGKMHGFLRMYWAKKILEWTKTPKEALEIAIYLNDKYELDGRDPNGFVGCMWSICGIHDQGWAERPVFGKIRYMNYKGCQRKFDVKAFEQKYSKKG